MNTDRRIDPIRLLTLVVLGLALLVFTPRASAATTLCTAGSGPGQCSAPTGLALDISEGETASGRLYVADSGNNRIDVFGPDDAFLSSFTGSGANQLSGPSSVAVDPATHDVYVADLGNERVERFDESGSFLNAIGEGEYASSSVMLVAVAPSGNVIVADSSPTARIRLREYEPGGGAPLRAKAEVVGAQENLDGMAVDSTGLIYIRETPGGGGESLCGYDATTWEATFCFPEVDSQGVLGLALDGEDRLFDGGIDRDAEVKLYRVIAEYDPAGASLRRFGYGTLSGFVDGLAIRGEEEAYAAETAGNVVRIVPFPPPGPIAVGPAAEGITSFRATVHAEVNPEGEEVHYRFQYLTQVEYEEQGGSFEGPATKETEPGTLAAATRLERAEAPIGCPDPETEASKGKCLAPETDYRWRIVAESEAGPGEGSVEGTLTTTRPLEVVGTWPTAVGTDSAVLHARLDTFGIPATGFFQYVTEAEYQADLAAGGDGFASAARLPASGELHLPAEEGASTSAALFPLAPGTVYRFRFLALNPLIGTPVAGPVRSLGTLGPPTPVPCPQEGIRGGLTGARTGPAAFLPDCRAYEMVSPVDKNGADVVPPEVSDKLPAALEQSAVGGDRMAYSSRTAFADPDGAPWTSQYIARRAWEGWVSHAISSPRERALVKVLEQAHTEFEAFSPDLCGAWLHTYSDPVLAPGAVEGSFDLYRRTDDECGGRSYEAITTIAPPSNPIDFATQLEGVSGDGGRTIYRVNDALPGTGAPAETAGCAGHPSKCEPRLYSQDASEGSRYVCLLPGGGPAGACAAGATVSGGAYYRESSLQNAISVNGERIFWSTPAPGDGRIFLSENPGAPSASRLHGSAAGSGNVIGPAKGEGRILKNQLVATGVLLESGGFVVGQEVTDSAAVLPAGTRVEALELEKEEQAGTQTVSYYRLTFDQAATGNALKDTFTGHASPTLGDVTTESGGFEASQSVEAPGIPAGTTIEAVGAGSLTLSATPAASREGAHLEAFGPCIRPLTGSCSTQVSLAAELAQGTSASHFWGAAADGSVAIFTTGGALYSYDVEAGATRKIAGEVTGVAGIDEDASHIYFATNEALSGANVEERNGQGAAAVAGGSNLYLYEAPEGGRYAFIGTLVGDGSVSAIASSPAERLSRVTPSGGALAFMTHASLTGFDNADASTGQPDMEVYLYQAASRTLLCASCNPTGARPVGGDSGRGYEGANAPRSAGWIPGWETSLYAPRALSDSGRRLFFSSDEQLVARDTDGHTDVYEWEAPGEGSCAEASPAYVAADGGCIYLISSGLAARDVEFRDASPSGDDVFFATAVSLLPQDPALVDIYDARVGGGLPIPRPPAGGCEGEACQSPPAAPNDPTPASSAFEGPGNVREAATKKHKAKRCRKGRRKVRKHGRVRCVRKAHRKTHRAHHRRKGHGGAAGRHPRRGRGR